MLNAKNENIIINGHDFDYISFGSGRDVLIMLPGVGDGFKTAKGMAVPFAFMYRMFAVSFRVYVFSRRNDLPDGFTSDDLSNIMDALDIGAAHIFGVSQGGMIAQQMAIRHPEKVKSLVLAVTAARPTRIMREALESWLLMAERNDYKGIMLDTAERSYTGTYLERGKRMNKLIALAKPKSYERFRILCESCLSHDVYEDLPEIRCPVYIIGASLDRVLGPEASAEMHEAIPGSEIYMFEGYSHGVYEQAKDFNEMALRWLWRQKLREDRNAKEE